MGKNERNIWKSLLLALATTPMVFVAIFIIFELIRAFNILISKILSAGYGWVIIIIVYVLSLLYFIYKPKIRKNREMKKAVNSLGLYLQEQIGKENIPQPSEADIKLINELLLERVKVWVWFDLELWNGCFPDEKYPQSFFGNADSLLEQYKQHLNKSVS